MPGSILGAGASVASASMQADAANHATDTQLQMYQQTRSDLMPYMSAGIAPVNNLSSLLGYGGAPNTGGVSGYNSSTSALPTYNPGAPYTSPTPTAAGIGQAITGGVSALGPNGQPNITPGVNGAPATGTWPDGTPITPTQMTYIRGLGTPTGQSGLPGYSAGVTNSGLPVSGSNVTGPTQQTGAVGASLSALNGYNPSATGNPMLDALRNYPGYQFAQQEGVNALDRSAASKGLVLSGGQLRAVTQYGQGLADQLFPQYFNQNLQLSQLGEDAAARVGNAGSNAASGAASSMMAAGTANASGIAGAANQIGSRLPSWDPFGSNGTGSTGQTSGPDFGWT